ncbi:MAG: metallophosphoesterase [Planctomycetes bacterium]|nr:metallophosphoesterase [Planctomycetota bacterium]
MNRRAFLKVALAAGGAAALGTGAYTFGIGPWHVEFTRSEIHLPGLPPALDGLKLVHLSDFHPNRFISAEYLDACMDQANAWEPDLIVATGDFISYGPGDLAVSAAALARLRAPRGVYACVGNHDFHFGIADAVAALRNVGHCEVLVNRNTLLRPRGEPLRLIGLDDLWFGNLDLPQALRGTASGETRLVLLHNPDFFDRLAPAGVDLVLAGHTHGGQVCLPVLGAPVVPSREGRYVKGLYRAGRTQMYITRGLGCTFVPARLGSRPEISGLVLRRATA